MPRKPKLAQELKIESLSTGREIRPESLICDITGDVIPVVQDMRPVRELDSAEVVREKTRRIVRERKMQLLNNTLYVKPKLVELVPKGKRKIGELNGMAVLVDMPPWRRI